MKTNNSETKKTSKTEVVATSEFNELVTVIVDYYCFKGEFNTEEGDEWKEGTPHQVNFAVPSEIDGLIEKAFVRQLEKYIK